MQIRVARKANRKERPKTPAYWSMEEKFSMVKPLSRVVKAYTTTSTRGATTKNAIQTT